MKHAARRLWNPPPKAYPVVQRLLHRRAALVQPRTLLRHFTRLIQQRLRQALQAAGCSGDVRRCQAIEGVGPITAAALAVAFHRARSPAAMPSGEQVICLRSPATISRQYPSDELAALQLHEICGFSLRSLVARSDCLRRWYGKRDPLDESIVAVYRYRTTSIYF